MSLNYKINFDDHSTNNNYSSNSVKEPEENWRQQPALVSVLASRTSRVPSREILENIAAAGPAPSEP
jgi:hypothetical protein